MTTLKLSETTSPPNQTGFSAPAIRLPAVQREELSYKQHVFDEETQPVQQIPANANVSKNPPEEYLTSNSLRTQYGSGGQQTRVITNYVAVKKAPTKLHQYTVSFNFTSKGTIKRKSELRHVFESLKNLHPLQSRNDWATDFTYVWSVRPLFDGEELVIAEVCYFTLNGRPASIPKVTFTKELELDLRRGHLDLVEDRNTNGGTDVAMKSRALNAIVSHFMCLSTSAPIAQFGANRFFLTDAYKDIANSPFLTMRGYFSSIRPGNDRILLNVNTTTSAFFKPMLVSQYISTLQQRLGMNIWAITGMLKRQVVRITYDRPIRPGSKVDLNMEESRRKTIAGFGNPPAQQTFYMDGMETTVFAFYKDSPGCPLHKDSAMPCVNVGVAKPGKEQWIPAEFLEIIYPQPYSATLPPAYTNDMMRVALREPAANAKLIVNEGLVHLGIKNTDPPSGSGVSKVLSMDEIGFDIDNKLIDIPARILNGPKLQFSSKGPPRTVVPMFASWKLADGNRTKVFAACSQLPRVGILTLDSSRFKSEELARNLRNRLVAHGVQVANGATWYSTVNPRPDQESSYVRSMNEVISSVEKEMRKNGITVVVLQKHDDDVYSALKKVCDTRGLLTACCASPSNKILHPQTLSNIALKFSMKTGGRPHQIYGGLLVEPDTMIMGADVTHPGSDAKTHCPSVAAAVASFDEHAINYSGSMRLQKSKQEVIDVQDMQGMANELLNTYGSKNRKLPSNILYYRDGVSNGQYSQVREKEVRAIENAWMVLKNANRPSDVTKVRITCIVVEKRHHTRFYPSKVQDADRSYNVKPGLVVDSVITHPYCFDFYLQSHAAVKGTARSAHYVLLRSDMKLDPVQLQNLTHSLCYAYGTATKGISYCAPAYHADKLCDRGRCYIRDWLLNRPELSRMILPHNQHQHPRKSVQEHEKDEARRLGSTRPFNVWETAQNGVHKGRKNPWHRDLDGKMFWV